MAQKLRKLRISKIAFVDQGANPKAFIALCKRKEDQMAEPTTAELAAKVTVAEAERDVAVAKAADLETKLAEATKTPPADDVLKGLTPEAAEKVKALMKANEDQAARIEKIEADRNREQMIRKCSQEFRALGAAEDLAGLLLPIAKALPKPEYEDLLKRLRAWNEQVRQSALFKAVGVDGGDEAPTPEEKLASLAKEYQKAHGTEEGMTYEIAYDRVFKSAEGQALYKATKSPTPGGR